MSIRRQSIISSLVIYIGFAVGLLNTYLFTRQGRFSEEQFGLYNAFIAIATMMMAVSNFAMPSYIYKFFPYYKDHLPEKKNDQAAIAFTVSSIGFIIVLVAGIVFKDLVIRKYSANAGDIIVYYNWIFVLGLGLLFYNILEAYAWQLHRSVLTNFLKEVAWRAFTLLLIVLYLGNIISFDTFIRLFAFSYPFIALVLLAYLLFTGQLHFTFTISKVTRRLRKSIWRLCSFVYPGSLIFTVSFVFDSLVISSVLENALAWLAVYSVAQNIVAMIQVPQRGIIAASIAHLSRAWKDKNTGLIQRIYQRSSINQLLFAAGLFSLILLSFTDAVETFHLKGTYLEAYYVVIFLGLAKIVDMGTGVNAQIIATSTYWRFEMLSGVALLIVMMPLSVILTKQYGITGAGVANLVSMCVYNGVRILFLWRKFRLFPFTVHTIQTVVLAGIAYAVCYFSFREIHGWAGMFARSISFMLLFGSAAIIFKLSPDISPVLQSIRKRFSR